MENNMNKKICTKCNIEKDTNQFYKLKTGKFGVRSECKECAKEYYENNKETIVSYKKEYYKINKEKLSKKSKMYNENNKEKIKEWRENNKESIKQKDKEWYRNNKESILEKANEYKKERRSTDPLYKLTFNIRNLIRISLKNGGYKKNTKTANILGCDYETFKNHIESQFEPWMDWSKHGLYNGELNYGFDLDHIIPISTAKNEEEAYKLNHYTNLRPLCSYINRNIKKDKINY